MQSQLNAERQELSQAHAVLENERAESAAVSLYLSLSCVFPLPVWSMIAMSAWLCCSHHCRLRSEKRKLGLRRWPSKAGNPSFKRNNLSFKRKWRWYHSSCVFHSSIVWRLYVTLPQRERESIASLRTSLQLKQSSLQDETKKFETAIAEITQRQAVLVNLDAELQTRAASLSQREQQLEVNERVRACSCEHSMMSSTGCACITGNLRWQVRVASATTSATRSWEAAAWSWVRLTFQASGHWEGPAARTSCVEGT